jgi:hypothetical protein
MSINETVTLKLTRYQLYAILNAATTRNIEEEEAVNVCRENIHIPECETILNELEEGFENQQAIRAERNSIISKSINND